MATPQRARKPEDYENSIDYEFRKSNAWKKINNALWLNKAPKNGQIKEVIKPKWTPMLKIRRKSNKKSFSEMLWQLAPVAISITIIMAIAIRIKAGL